MFDVDGTLVDSQHGIVEAQRRAFARVGLVPPDRERMLSVVGLSLREAFAALVGADGPVDRLVEAYKDAWTELRAEPGFTDPLYPGAAALVAALAGRQGVRLGLATGKSRKGVDRLLREQGWCGTFATVQTADDHPSKPDPAMLRAALAETGCAAAVMVGDTTFDMAMALAAGVRPLGVGWGYHPSGALRAAGAAMVLADMAGLAACLDAWLDARLDRSPDGGAVDPVPPGRAANYAPPGADLAAEPTSRRGARLSDPHDSSPRAPASPATEPSALAANDPFALARRDLKRALPRRFYVAATAGPLSDGSGHGVFLDGRPVRTPAKALLAVPSPALAAALAAEWQDQGEIVEPDLMPLTRLANSAIDGVASAMAETAAEVARFAETDLLCYRASDPAALVEAQGAAWDPVLARVGQRLGARFVLVEGVMFAAQPEASLAAVRRAVDDLSRDAGGVIRLAALSVMTNLSGSVLLALAVAWGDLAVAEAWATAHVDEDHQMRLWGADAEAAARRDRRWRDMAAAAEACGLLRG